MKKIIYTASFALLIHGALLAPSRQSSTLELVHVVYRHGDRTPESSYPLDPNKGEDYFPYGFGELTNKGKEKEYELGRYLRKGYNNFLGNLYTPDIIDVRATDYNRTKMSALLCTAGLFPPVGVNEWNPIDWQPIPYNYQEKAYDFLTGTFFTNSVNFNKAYRDFLLSDEGKLLLKPYQSFFLFLANKTGVEIIDPLDALGVADTIFTQMEFGLDPPKWCNHAVLLQLRSVIEIAFQSTAATETLRQYSGGALLKKIISDSLAKIDDKLSPKRRKMFIYSAHDITVYAIMRAMNLMLERPPYGSYVLVELHRIDHKPHLRVLYQDYSDENPIVYNIRNCQEFCPIDTFIDEVSQNLPPDL